MKVPFGWHVWGWFTLLASLGIHGFLLSLPMSFSLDAPEPEPEPIAAVPLTTLPKIASPPPEPLVSDGKVSSTSEVMSVAEVYEAQVSPPPEVFQAVEVYEPEVYSQPTVEIESELFDRTPSFSRERNQQLSVKPAVDLEELRQRKILSMKEQAALSSESPLHDRNLDKTSPNIEFEMLAQMDTDLDSYLETFNQEDRSLVDTKDAIVDFLASISLVSPDNMLNNLLLDDSGHFKEGIIPDKLRLISLSEDEQMTTEQIYENAIALSIDLEEYKIEKLSNVQEDINEDKIYSVEKKQQKDFKFYIQLIMVRSPIPNQKIAAIVVWNQQPEPLFPK